ncbi:C1 family peptidase [Microcoleus sp. FACHB-831]|jgi:C1A family cysteine protease|uniref:C1 family peptidase n=1 Tax=Microcoleus sp. FACHB-831 TaxID=2692827 RepID=UPI0016843AD2|nr:C1 family peptidase [Microcoleus sp. FACHB-831]MBD1920380.1 C1 family peptidase [Microcoleus sp. FACHB-831]
MTTQPRGYGWIPDRPDSRDIKYSAPQQVISNLPPKVDLRSQLPAVYEQGSIGSCTAQSISAAFYFCQTKQKIFSFEPSKLFTYYVTRDIEGTINQDCGATLRNTIKSINKFGVCPESIWPYKPERLMVQPTPTCYDTASRHIAISYSQVTQSLRQLKGCLASGFPFALGMTIYETFESEEVAKTGKLNLPWTNEQLVGGHAVLAVGYDDSQKRFILRNSWGKQWGMAGYFTVPYDYILNPDLAADFWTVRIVK